MGSLSVLVGVLAVSISRCFAEFNLSWGYFR